MKKAILLAFIVGIILLTGCATASLPPDLKAVHYSGGSLSSKTYQNCLNPSERSGWDPGDGYYMYPTRQISYEASSEKGAEHSAFTVISSDNAELEIPVTVTFTLDTDCDTLRKFHETIGSRFAAYITVDSDSTDNGGNGDGELTSADYPDGWVSLLNYAIGKPLDATMDRIAQDYKYRDVWNNNEVKIEIEKAINENLAALVSRQAGGEFFDNYQVLVQKPNPTDDNLKKALSDEQAAVAQSNADKAKAEADTATAKAQKLLAEADAKTKQAEIDGFGGIENYLRYICITTSTCGNPFRDQFLYGGSPAQ